jgi:hypothetical protein
MPPAACLFSRRVPRRVPTPDGPVGSERSARRVFQVTHFRRTTTAQFADEFDGADQMELYPSHVNEFSSLSPTQTQRRDGKHPQPPRRTERNRPAATRGKTPDDDRSKSVGQVTIQREKKLESLR